MSLNSFFSSPPPLLSVLLLKILLRKLLRKTPLFIWSKNSIFSLFALCPFLWILGSRPRCLVFFLASLLLHSQSSALFIYSVNSVNSILFTVLSTCCIPICEHIMQSKTHITSNNSGYYKNAAIKKVYRPVNSEFTNNHFPRAPAEIIKECELRSVSKSS